MARLYGIQQLSLFGSLARTEASADSDVDLCVSLDSPNPFALVHFQETVHQHLGLRVDVVTRWPGMNKALQQEIEREFQSKRDQNLAASVIAQMITLIQTLLQRMESVQSESDPCSKPGTIQWRDRRHRFAGPLLP
jgi:predicted nucleotidyltransferase